jgi:hypothetical protein
MASFRRFAVALLAASFLVAAVGAQPMDPNQPKNPFMSDPNVIPVYPPTYVSCYNDTHGRQGSEPTCNVLALRCPRGCRDTCYVHCPSCKLICRKRRVYIYIILLKDFDQFFVFLESSMDGLSSV